MNKLLAFGAVGLLVGLCIGSFMHRHDKGEGRLEGRLSACNEITSVLDRGGNDLRCVVADGDVFITSDMSAAGKLYQLSGKPKD